MATLRGSRIRPELADADFSGIARGGRIQGQAFANLAGDIAGGIKKYQINKQELQKNIAKNDAILSNKNILASVEELKNTGEDNVPNGVLKALNARQNGTFTNQNEAILASYLETLQQQEMLKLQQRLIRSQIKEKISKPKDLFVSPKVADEQYGDFNQTPVVIGGESKIKIGSLKIILLC